MVVAVALALPDKFIRVVGEEEHRVLRLYIPVVLFSEQIGLFLAGQGGITDQLHFILVAVQLGDIDTFLVRTPGYICQILLFRCSGLQPDSLPVRQVIDADGYFMALHACHRILPRFRFGTTGIDIHDGIIGYHTFIHPVKG